MIIATSPIAGRPPLRDSNDPKADYWDTLRELTPENMQRVMEMLRGFIREWGAELIHIGNGVTRFRVLSATRERQGLTFEPAMVEGNSDPVMRITGTAINGAPVLLDVWPGTGAAYFIAGEGSGNHAMLTWGQDNDSPETLMIFRCVSRR